MRQRATYSKKLVRVRTSRGARTRITSSGRPKLASKAVVNRSLKRSIAEDREVLLALAKW